MSINFTIVALGSAFFAAIANILARVLLKENLRSKDIIGINFLTMGAILVLFSPTFYYFNATRYTLFLILLVSSIDVLANFFYFKTFEKTEASVATPILSLAPGFTFIFGWFLLGDVVSVSTYIISIIIIVLVIFFSTNFKDFKEFKTATLSPAILASILFGISAIPSKALLSTLHAINAPTLYMYRAGIIALFALLFFRFPIKEISIKQYRLIFVRSLFVIVQWLLLYFALSRGNAGVTITLGNITPIFVFIFGAIFLREKVTTRKVITALLILVLSLLIK
ncbi:MAG: DMT family transporter [Patescibacteria group bacterium]